LSFATDCQANGEQCGDDFKAFQAKTSVKMISQKAAWNRRRPRIR
jgi:hypothetical protein